MYYYGIVENELEFVESYLRNRIQYCNIDGSTSRYRYVSFGVPQGSILGPLLFLLYMNDLPCVVQGTDVAMFADHTSLSRTFKNVSELNNELIRSFINICEWRKANKLSLNTVKTDFMIIGTSKQLENLDTSHETTPYALYINNAPIRRVKQAKNLGLIIDEHLS